MDLTLTREQTERLSQQIASRVVVAATQLRHFLLVEDLVDSLKVPRSPPPSWLPTSTSLPLGGRRAMAGYVPSLGSTLEALPTLTLSLSWPFSSTS